LIQIGLRLAAEIGDESALAQLYREAGYIEVLEANYGGGEVSLNLALVHARAAGDPVAEAKIQTYLSISASDRGAYEEAEAHVRTAVEILSAADEDAWTAYAHASLARILLLIGKVREAAEAGEVGIGLARRARALTILPWAMVQTGEAFRFLDRRDDAETLFTEAFTMSDAIDDPCWEALSLRGLAMLRRDAGDVPGAIELLEDGLARSQRLPDVYAWARAAILVELAELEHGSVPDHLNAARSLATAGPMPDFQARLLAIAVPQTPAQTTAR
jgi:tetratricopeptide (TPR) repeat protein